jgi:hypothetical protein
MHLRGVNLLGHVRADGKLFRFDFPRAAVPETSVGDL